MGKEETDKSVDRIARLASQRGISVGAAESLTSGAISSRLGAGPDAASWFAGSVVAYQEPVKFRVLDVAEGPVVTATCALEMAAGVRDLLQTDVAVSATGVGGPEPSEGHPPGTVFVSVVTSEDATTRELELSGGPEEVLSATVDAALDLLVELLGAS